MKKAKPLEKEAKVKLANLYEKINLHNKKYYQDNNPSITDSEYDDLFREASQLEKDFPNLKTFSITFGGIVIIWHSNCLA